MANFPGKPTISTMKHEIKNVIDSYHNEYDVMAELIQNAVDAIKNKREITKNFNGKINIKIDSNSKEIIVEDNGIGMSKNTLDKVVQVNESGKMNDSKTIGEKGVGLSFSLFNSNYAEIISTNNYESSKIVAENANIWLNSNEDSEFSMPINSITKRENSGTYVRLNLANSNENSFFNLNISQLKFVLRTKTAIGNVNSLFDENIKPIKVKLKYNNPKESINNEILDIKNNYYLFDDVSKNNIISLDDFNYWLKEKDRSDVQKRQKLQGKYITIKGKENHGGREIKYFAYFAPNNDDWKERSKRLGLINKSIDNDYSQNNYFEISNGAYLSVKGMPTGISVGTDRLLGSSGYVRRMFLIIEDPNLSLDLGRKSIPGRTKGMYIKIEQSVFGQYRTIAQKYIAKEMRANSDDDEDISATFNKLKANSIKIDGDTNFLYSPNQEGSVAGIFFEQLGKGKFPGLKILEHGYSNVYDIYATDNDFSNIVIEFKQHLTGFLKDASESIKKWTDVKYIVVFAIDEKDKKEANKLGVALEEFKEKDKKHFGASAKMQSQFNQPIYIIELEKIIRN